MDSSLRSKYFSLLTLFLIAVAYSAPANSGVMELSATYSTRSSQIDADNYNESESITASFGWYFMELSALELSYTSGTGKLSAKADDEDHPTVYTTEMDMYGADLVFTFATRESAIQPFIKGGMAAVKKKIFRKNSPDDGGGVDEISANDGFKTVPSWGVGIKINLTKTLSLRGSYDRWRSANDSDDSLWDDAIRGGISVLF